MRKNETLIIRSNCRTACKGQGIRDPPRSHSNKFAIVRLFLLLWSLFFLSFFGLLRLLRRRMAALFLRCIKAQTGPEFRNSSQLCLPAWFTQKI